MTSRRSFLGALLASAAAPAFVRAQSLMPLWVPRTGLILPGSPFDRVGTFTAELLGPGGVVLMRQVFANSLADDGVNYELDFTMRRFGIANGVAVRGPFKSSVIPFNTGDIFALMASDRLRVTTNLRAPA